MVIRFRCSDEPPLGVLRLAVLIEPCRELLHRDGVAGLGGAAQPSCRVVTPIRLVEVLGEAFHDHRVARLGPWIRTRSASSVLPASSSRAARATMAEVSPLSAAVRRIASAPSRSPSSSSRLAWSCTAIVSPASAAWRAQSAASSL